MKTRTPLIVAALAMLSAPVSALASGPIVPLVKAIGIQHVLIISFVLLGLVVALKSAAFARYQNKLSFRKALLWMLAATVFTSIIGVMVPAMVESGGAIFVAAPLVWGLSLLPAQRVIAGAPLSPFARYSPRGLALAVTAVLVLSYFLFIMSRNVQDAAGQARYWIVKFSGVYLALIIGIAVTAFWEEWILWRFSNSRENDTTFVRPVIRANLVVLASVVLISAAVLIPKRLGSTSVPIQQPSQTALQSPHPAATSNH